MFSTAEKWEKLVQNLLALESWRRYFVKHNGFQLLFEALGVLINKLKYDK